MVNCHRVQHIATSWVLRYMGLSSWSPGPQDSKQTSTWCSTYQCTHTLGFAALLRLRLADTDAPILACRTSLGSKQEASQATACQSISKHRTSMASHGTQPTQSAHSHVTCRRHQEHFAMLWTAHNNIQTNMNRYIPWSVVYA